MAVRSRAVFRHSPAEWTVGDLREALEGLPPGTRLSIHVALSPGRESWEEQIVVGLWTPAASGGDSHAAIVLADMPNGLYLKDPQDRR